MRIESSNALEWMIFLARLFLGLTYLLSGLSWFLGFLPLPTMHNPDMPVKHQVVAEMIDTGWMFQFAKIVEVAAGAALLTNRFVPLALAIAAPVALLVFLLDAFIFNSFIQFFSGEASWIYLADKILDMIVGGACTLLPHAFLIFAYWKYFEPLMAFRAVPSQGVGATPGAGRFASTRHAALIALGVPAILLAAVNSLWLAGMVNQWLIPWSSLKILSLG